MEEKGIIFSNENGVFKKLPNGVVVPYNNNSLCKRYKQKKYHVQRQKRVTGFSSG